MGNMAIMHDKAKAGWKSWKRWMVLLWRDWSAVQSSEQTAQLYLSLRSWSNSGWSDFAAQNTPTQHGPASAGIRLVASNPEPRRTEKSLPSHWPVKLPLSAGGWNPTRGFERRKKCRELALKSLCARSCVCVSACLRDQYNLTFLASKLLFLNKALAWQ